MESRIRKPPPAKERLLKHLDLRLKQKSVGRCHLLGLLLNFMEHHGSVIYLGILQQGAHNVRNIHRGKIARLDYLQGKMLVAGEGGRVAAGVLPAPACTIRYFYVSLLQQFVYQKMKGTDSKQRLSPLVYSGRNDLWPA